MNPVQVWKGTYPAVPLGGPVAPGLNPSHSLYLYTV